MFQVVVTRSQKSILLYSEVKSLLYSTQVPIMRLSNNESTVST